MALLPVLEVCSAEAHAGRCRGAAKAPTCLLEDMHLSRAVLRSGRGNQGEELQLLRPSCLLHSKPQAQRGAAGCALVPLPRLPLAHALRNLALPLDGQQLRNLRRPRRRHAVSSRDIRRALQEQQARAPCARPQSQAHTFRACQPNSCDLYACGARRLCQRRPGAAGALAGHHARCSRPAAGRRRRCGAPGASSARRAGRTARACSCTPPRPAPRRTAPAGRPPWSAWPLPAQPCLAVRAQAGAVRAEPGALRCRSGSSSARPPRGGACSTASCWRLRHCSTGSHGG